MVCPSAPLKTVLFAPNPFGPRQNASTVEQVEARKESRSTAEFRKPVSFASLLAVQRREGLSGCARVHQVTNPFDDVTSRVLPVVRQQLKKFPPHPP